MWLLLFKTRVCSTWLILFDIRWCPVMQGIINVRLLGIEMRNLKFFIFWPTQQIRCSWKHSCALPRHATFKYWCKCFHCYLWNAFDGCALAIGAVSFLGQLIDWEMRLSAIIKSVYWASLLMLVVVRCQIRVQSIQACLQCREEQLTYLKTVMFSMQAGEPPCLSDSPR